MKIIYLILISLSLNCYAATETADKNDYIGSWEEHKGFGIAGVANKVLNKTTNSLVIKPAFNVEFTRTFDSGKTQTFSALQKDIIFSNEFIIIPFSADNQLRYKLVISGWRSEHNKLIFGTLYLYSEGQLFNGIPVSFKPKAVNKSLNLTGAKDAQPS